MFDGTEFRPKIGLSVNIDLSQNKLLNDQPCSSGDQRPQPKYKIENQQKGSITQQSEQSQSNSIYDFNKLKSENEGLKNEIKDLRKKTDKQSINSVIRDRAVLVIRNNELETKNKSLNNGISTLNAEIQALRLANEKIRSRLHKIEPTYNQLRIRQLIENFRNLLADQVAVNKQDVFFNPQCFAQSGISEDEMDLIADIYNECHNIVHTPEWDEIVTAVNINANKDLFGKILKYYQTHNK